MPSVREMATHWNCTVGTVQRAYEELSNEGLVVSRPGQGTSVATITPVEQADPLRRATLVNKTEAFLLEVLTAGYTQVEIEQAMRLALDRWRTLQPELDNWPASTLRFVGSHDPAVSLITSKFAEFAPDYTLQLSFTGSLGGLIALAEGEADIAGIHLWDEETDTYNVPFVRRLLPGRRVALLTLAHRHLGLAISPAVEANITGLVDLPDSGIRFINRQRGAGTRVWLDAQLRRLGISADSIAGYDEQAQTHSEVVRKIAENQADVGVAIESAALTYGLKFVSLTTERYDLAVPVEFWSRPPLEALAQWLTTAQAKQNILALGGYDVAETGQVNWLEN